MEPSRLTVVLRGSIWQLHFLKDQPKTLEGIGIDCGLNAVAKIVPANSKEDSHSQDIFIFHRTNSLDYKSRMDPQLSKKSMLTPN